MRVSTRLARGAALGLAALSVSAPALAEIATDCPKDAGITLPRGFCATVFADGIGHARHLAVSSEGVVYVNSWSGPYYGDAATPHPGGFLVALRDTAGTGRADVVIRFGASKESGATGGTGLALHKGALYAEEGDRILRYALPPGAIAPEGAPDTILSGLPLSGDHPMHPFVIDAEDGLYVDSGSATNACQIDNRAPESPGAEPCAELETRAGVWRYDASRLGQIFSPAGRHATGLRNAEGLAIDAAGALYATQHGRDQLAENWPRLFAPARGAELPAEVLLRIERGADYGWPFCYYDGARRALRLAPEYGGDGETIGACAGKTPPIAAFPAHWAPNALALYEARQFPDAYRGGAFIAFHGSWNRAPAPQGGYNIVFQPLAGGAPSGPFVVFADGFAGPVKEPGAAAHRPSGVAVGPDGALFISDDVTGRIWRVTYHGDAARGVEAAPPLP